MEDIAVEFAGHSNFVAALLAHAYTCEEMLRWKAWHREAQAIARNYPGDAPKGGSGAFKVYGDLKSLFPMHPFDEIQRYPSSSRR